MRIKNMLYALYLLILSAGESYLLMVMSFILLIISILLDVNQYLNERDDSKRRIAKWKIPVITQIITGIFYASDSNTTRTFNTLPMIVTGRFITSSSLK